MSEPLTREELEALRRIPTPAISNAIELFEIRPRTAGYASSEIACRFPDLGPVIGYAATAVTTAASPHGRRAAAPDYWQSVLAVPGPVSPSGTTSTLRWWGPSGERSRPASTSLWGAWGR